MTYLSTGEAGPSFLRAICSDLGGLLFARASVVSQASFFLCDFDWIGMPGGVLSCLAMGPVICFLPAGAPASVGGVLFLCFISVLFH